MDLRSILHRNGFTPKEADVYLASLELGMAPISVIAKKARVQRTTTYEVLKKLSEKGIAEFFLRKRTRYYSVLPPKLLLARLRSSADELESALPALTAISNEIVHKPRITFYEGKEDLRRLYLDCLRAKGDICNYFQPDATIRYFGWDWLRGEMVTKLIEKGMRVRVIMPPSAWAKRFLQERESADRRQKIIAGKHAPFRNEVVIYDDTVAHFSFDDDFAFLIQSKDVADTHRAVFNLAWESGSLTHNA